MEFSTIKHVDWSLIIDKGAKAIFEYSVFFEALVAAMCFPLETANDIINIKKIYIK